MSPLDWILLIVGAVALGFVLWPERQRAGKVPQPEPSREEATQALVAELLKRGEERDRQRRWHRWKDV